MSDQQRIKARRKGVTMPTVDPEVLGRCVACFLEEPAMSWQSPDTYARIGAKLRAELGLTPREVQVVIGRVMFMFAFVGGNAEALAKHGKIRTRDGGLAFVGAELVKAAAEAPTRPKGFSSRVLLARLGIPTGPG